MGWILQDSSGLSLMWISIDPSQESLALKPDKGGKSTRAGAATVRKEARVSHGAITATINSGDSTRGEPQTRQLVNVSHVLAGVEAWHEGFSSDRQLLHEGFAHFRADFKGLWANGRAQPDQHIGWLAAQAFESGFKHTRCQPTPTGMGGRHASTGAVAEQRGQTIGSHGCAGDTRRAGPTAIGFGDARGVSLDHGHAVDLAQPRRLNIKGVGQTTAILKDGFKAVLDMIAQVEAVERRQTDAARTGGDAGFNLSRRWPVRNQPVIHPINASRSCLSSDNNQTRSSGRGDSQLIRLPLVG